MTFLVAGNLRLAIAVDADGLHLPESLARRGVLTPALAWRRGSRLLTVACHGVHALARARVMRADAALLSPAFPTASHPGAPALGPCRFASLAAIAACPVIALGGLTPATARRLPAGTAVGLAAVGAWAAGKV